MRVPLFTLIAFTTIAAAAHAAPAKPKIDAELDKLLAGKRPLKDFTLNVRWTTRVGGFRARSAVVYGKGVGIWRGNTQFKIAAKEIRQLVKTLKDQKFSSLKRNYGGFGRGGAGGPRLGRPEVLVGAVSVRIGDTHAGSIQAGGGEQSAALAKLADTLLTICEKAAKRSPVTAASLDAGLSMLAKGDLLPETFSLLVHRLIMRGGKPGEEGFLLRMQGRTVTTRRRPKGKIGPEVRLELTEKQYRKVLDLLVKNEPGKFPVNLWAQHYTDFNLTVLNHRKSMQARQFARLTPQTHGEKQKQFDRIFAAMQALHQRVLKEGKEVPPPK